MTTHATRAAMAPGWRAWRILALAAYGACLAAGLLGYLTG